MVTINTDLQEEYLLLVNVNVDCSLEARDWIYFPLALFVYVQCMTDFEFGFGALVQQ